MIARSISLSSMHQQAPLSSMSRPNSFVSSPTLHYPTILQRVRRYGLPKLTIQNIHRLFDRTTNTSSATTTATKSTTFSFADLCQYCVTLAKAGDTIWHLNAYESIVDHDTIMQQAAAADERRRQRQSANIRPESSILLDGIPVAIKSNIATATQPFTAGSRILGAARTSHGSTDNHSRTNSTTAANTHIVGYDADVTTQLLYHSNAILIGTTTMDEFGMGSLGTNTTVSASGATNSNTILLPKNPIPFICHSNNDHSTNGVVEPWNDQNVIEFIQLPEEAIYNIHYDLLQPLLPVLQQHEEHQTWLSSSTDQYRPNTPDSDSVRKVDRVESNDGNTPTNQSYAITHQYHYSPGGSSCGSAISVRHGSAIVSIGSDTGGSVRLPASYNNIVGFKPSYGVISRYGLIPYANSFDTIGIIGNTTHCIATTYQHLIRGNRISDNTGNGEFDIESNSIKSKDDAYVVRDSTQSTLSSAYVDSIRHTSVRLSSLSTSAGNFIHPSNYDRNGNSGKGQSLLNHQEQPLKGIKIGIPEAFSIEECSLSVRTVWEDCAVWMQQHGATVGVVTKEQISPLLIQQCLASYYILVCAEASSNLLRYDGFRYGSSVPMNIDDFIYTDDLNNNDYTTLSILEQQYAITRTQLLGKEVIRRILCGAYVLSADQYHAYYEQAAKIRAEITKQFSNTFSQYDMLLLPNTMYPPPKICSGTTTAIRIDPTEMLANDIMTVPISLTGYPAISISINGSSWYSRPIDAHQSHFPDPDPTLQPPFQISMQLVGPRFSEPNILNSASVLEQFVARTEH